METNPLVYASLKNASYFEPDASYREYLAKISKTPDKKYYLTIDQEMVNDPDTNQPSLYPADKMSFFTPEINMIRMKMPEFPPLYDWEYLNKVWATKASS